MGFTTLTLYVVFASSSPDPESLHSARGMTSNWDEHWHQFRSTGLCARPPWRAFLYDPGTYLNAIEGCTTNGCRATATGCAVSCSTGTCAFLCRQLSLHRMRASVISSVCACAYQRGGMRNAQQRQNQPPHHPSPTDDNWIFFGKNVGSYNFPPSNGRVNASVDIYHARQAQG